MTTAQATAAAAQAFLVKHRLEPLPRNYEFAYAYSDGFSDGLIEAVEQIVDGGVRISQQDADRLSAQFLGRSNPSTGSEPAVIALIREQALRLADLATAASLSTGEFRRDLTAGLPACGTASPNELEKLVATMVARAERAERELAETSAEVQLLRQKLESVQIDAEHDALTGLPNRRGLQSHLETLAQLNDPICIALCDIDHFKTYNDRYGHSVGDRVLKTVAVALQEYLPRQFVCRWGGEEFLVVVRGDLTKAGLLIEEAKDKLGGKHFRLRETDEPMGPITFSAGVAPLLRGAGQLDAALTKADKRLYAAKRAGRDCVIASDGST